MEEERETEERKKVDENMKEEREWGRRKEEECGEWNRKEGGEGYG